MSTEDFTTYTESDEGGDIVVDSASQATITTMLRNVIDLLYKDAGAGHFAEGFRHKVQTQFTATGTNGIGLPWMMTNAANDWRTIVVASGTAIGVRWYNSKLVLLETLSGSSYTDESSALSEDTDYYLTVERDEAVGANGTLYCYIYSDSGRTSLVDTITLALNAKTDFRYIFAVSSHDSSSTETISFIVSNLDLQEGVAKLAMHYRKMMEAA